MPQIDFFDFFRYAAGTVVTIYATVVIVQSIVQWYKILVQQDRYTTLLRRYLVVSGLRLKVRNFGPDVLVMVLLCVVFGIIWYEHGLVRQIDTALTDARRSRSIHLHWRASEAPAAPAGDNDTE